MLIKASDKYIRDLFSLWKEAFGDEDGYINLFFDTVYKENIIAFAEADNSKIVSVLYLMRSYIKYGSKLYDGYYLYAAATLKAYRGKGIMGKLINEAKDYVLSEGKSFISLVPGEEYLYSYYKKFGFESVMYRGKDFVLCDSATDKTADFTVAFENYFKNRQKVIDGASHHFSSEAYSYASKCYEYLGIKAIEAEYFSFIYDRENKCVTELLSSDGNETLKAFLPKGEYAVCSPNGEKKEKFGMVWFSDESLRIENIYMNIALD